MFGSAAEAILDLAIESPPPALRPISIQVSSKCSLDARKAHGRISKGIFVLHQSGTISFQGPTALVCIIIIA